MESLGVGGVQSVLLFIQGLSNPTSRRILLPKRKVPLYPTISDTLLHERRHQSSETTCKLGDLSKMFRTEPPVQCRVWLMLVQVPTPPPWVRGGPLRLHVGSNSWSFNLLVRSRVRWINLVDARKSLWSRFFVVLLRSRGEGLQE